eukprot:GFUD01082248.1.p1 GENE.GFUD01082248.1~~GFUD01082248.1.p1  ORF type:complete len:342 (+),score=53.06 GFUD01082248.1:98-1027(+)
MLRILFFLQREVNEFQGNTPVRDFLHDLITSGSKELMEKYLKNLVEDTKKASLDETYKKFMHDVYAGFKSGQKPLSEAWTDVCMRFIDQRIYDRESYFVLLRNVTTTLCTIPPSQLPKFLSRLENTVVGSGEISVMVKRGGRIVKEVGTQIAVVGLAAAQLSWEAIKNITLWLNNEISGKYCVKNVVDSLGSIAASVGGAYAGAAVGAVGGPVGLLAGGVVGSVAASYLSSLLMVHLTMIFFDLPKSAALENAYKVLGVHHKKDNSTINSAYRQLALTCHPDKPGGSKEKWFDLQIALQIIRVSRGETF